MEVIYHRARMELYERRAEAGRKLALHNQAADHECRKTGKMLKVVPFPQGGEHVPSIRVAGKWLLQFGFQFGDEIVLTAEQGQVLIARKEVNNHGHPLV